MEQQATYENGNPFGQAALMVKPQEKGLISVEQERAIAEVQAALVIAKKFPRDPIASVDKIINSCTRNSLAEHSLYEYSRGGTDITGPSIRLAEVIAQNWGNLICGVVELSRRPGESDCLSYAWDLETNFRDEKRFTVKHIRDTKKGSFKVESERDVYEVIANMGARRKRACILAVVPGDVVETAVKQCETTLKTKAAVTPERIANLLEKFAEFKVTKEQIEKRIQRHLDAITPAQMVNLGKIYNSLKDGMSTQGDWFEVESPKEEAKDKIESLKDKLRPITKPEPQPPAESPDTTAPEPPQPVKCPKCGIECASERGLKKHMTQSHPEKPPEPPPPLVDFETGEIAEENLDPFVKDAEKHLAELTDNNKILLLKLYGLKPGAKEEEREQLKNMAPGYREAFLQKCSKALDSQNARNGK